MTKTKTTVVGKIYETTNYGMFKLRDDNRLIKNHIVQKKIDSIKRMGQQQPITVDLDMNITDGQHRLRACEYLKIPVMYMVSPKIMSAADIADLQSSTSAWTNQDYARSFASEGNINYEQYNQFVAEFPEFSHSVVVTLLTGNTRRNVQIEEQFHNGTFVVKAFDEARERALLIRNLGKYYKGYRKRSFIYAVLTMMEHRYFDMSRLLRKMPKRCKDLMDFSRTEDYIDVLQGMYNWSESKKVHFV